MCLDVDDTLLDSERASRRGLVALTGNDAAWPVWRRITDDYYGRMLAAEMDFDTMRRERTRAFFAAFGERIDDAEAAERERVRMAAMRRGWQPFDDAEPCLEWLRACGLRLAVITNAPGGYQRTKLASAGLGGLFDALVISGEVGVAKPDERIFRTASDALGLDPGEVAHIGDRLDVDAAGAVRAGMHGVWLDRPGSGRSGPVNVPAGVSVISGLEQLPETLVCDLSDATVGIAERDGSQHGVARSAS